MKLVLKFCLVLSFSSLVISCSSKKIQFSNDEILILKIDSARIINSANEYLSVNAIPITEYFCERSAGKKNDFYSEGDYWWPNPEDPDGPYIRKDGMSNPNYFNDHREAMRNMSIQVASLTAAFKITGDVKYAEHSIKHLRKWFVEPETKMNPHMKYAQAIKGICEGRGVGLIDAIHLVEPARAIKVLKTLNSIDDHSYNEIRKWFSEFLYWMNTHEYGIDERERKNNHGTCWVMMASEFANLTDNVEMTEYCVNRFKEVLLPNQMSLDGSFHLELKRTKPYGYSLFNADIMSMVCYILSTEKENLFTFELPDKRNMKLGLEFIYPFIEDKSKWPYHQDVMYWDEWPVRHPSLLFGGMLLNNEKYIELWKKLRPLPESQEGLRNFPIREPILWVD